MAHEFEVGMLEKMRHIGLAAREEIVDAEHVVSVLQEALAKMRAEKTGSAGDQNLFQDEPPVDFLSCVECSGVLCDFHCAARPLARAVIVADWQHPPQNER
jgi:hypothetical protein